VKPASRIGHVSQDEGFVARVSRVEVHPAIQVEVRGQQSAAPVVVAEEFVLETSLLTDVDGSQLEDS
jgi:hypothetical protein